MRWRFGPIAVTAIVAVVTVAGCAETVDGSALRARPEVPDPDRSYGYVDDRCGLLVDETVQETLGADGVTRPYSGAVCQYVLFRGEETVDATYSWFESGTLDRERTVAAERGAEVTDIVVERHEAFTARRDITGAACSATAAAGSGVLSWWVQFRGRSAGDPCAEAEELLSATLRAEM
ncbi:DUF3558 domain-containing protein [Mycobacterium sp. IDR2000157661]|uniref:DUF3558 domain-containing protein n=1 Tax=Mycobacterium sp. IDR2000157661 TaxID=2867005 RepID=UPI001EEB3DB5|nr:DUF3558 domain-containing protein [Mycobacterium sp. IDR2000157661]ULE33908.1 DUF3558 domain-containing protein [Mycobacterium sp. IDR2000157661]